MAVTKREIYEAGRADERAEIVAWLRTTQHADPVGARLAGLIERGVHAVVEVTGDVGR